MVGLFLLAKPITYLIFAGGEFDEAAVNLTSSILMFFALSIPFEGVSHILSRAYYAHKNTLKPTVYYVIGMSVISLITLYVAPRFGIMWFSIGFSIGYAIYVLLLSLSIKDKVEGFKVKEFMISISKTIGSSLFMAAVILFTGEIFDNSLSARFVTILQVGFGLLAFFVAAFALKAQEIRSINFLAPSFFKRKK